MDGCMGGLVVGRVDVQVDGWVGSWMDGWVDIDYPCRQCNWSLFITGLCNPVSNTGSLSCYVFVSPPLLQNFRQQGNMSKFISG